MDREQEDNEPYKSGRESQTSWMKEPVGWVGIGSIDFPLRLCIKAVPARQLSPFGIMRRSISSRGKQAKGNEPSLEDLDCVNVEQVLVVCYIVEKRMPGSVARKLETAEKKNTDRD
jgi:hypothetical protein